MTTLCLRLNLEYDVDSYGILFILLFIIFFIHYLFVFFFFFSSRRRHTRWNCDWSSDVCSSDLSSTNSPTSTAPPENSTVVPSGPAERTFAPRCSSASTSPAATVATTSSRL